MIQDALRPYIKSPWMLEPRLRCSGTGCYPSLRPELLALHQISMDRQAVQHYYLRNDRQAVHQYTRLKTLRG